MNILTEHDLIQLTPNDLSCLLFGDDELHRCTLQSTERGEIYPVIIAQRSIGALIKSRDPTERILHVKLYSTHCEIWKTAFWRDSISRLTAVKRDDRIQREAEFRIEEKTAKVHAHLLTVLDFPDIPTTWDIARKIVVSEDKRMAQAMHVYHILYEHTPSESESTEGGEG